MKAKAEAIPTGVKYTDLGMLNDDVSRYLQRNYEFDGNDILLECHSVADRWNMIQGTKTMMGALIALRQKTMCREVAAHRKEVQAA